MDERISIVVAERNRLSTVRIILGSIYKNSRFKDHEIVFVGDRIDDPVVDWARVGDYKTLREYIPYWQKRFQNFTLVEGDWNREDIDNPKWIRTPVYESLNAGIDHASNDWIMVVGSDEFYCCNWDVNMIRHFGEYNAYEHVFIPVWGVLCCPHGDGPDGYDPDYHPDDHLGSAGHVACYIPRKVWRKHPLMESQLNEIYEKNKKDEVLVEPCGHRWQLFYWNMVVHRSVMEAMKKITIGEGAFGVSRKPGSYCDSCRFLFNKGSHAEQDPEGMNYCNGEKYCIREMHAGLDMEFDDLLWKELGVKKVGCLDSIMFHIKSYRHTVGRPDSFMFDLGEP